MPKNYYAELIANRLAEILDQKGLTDYQFAQLMGRTRSQISAWLKGESNLTLATIQAIEEVLDEPLILVTTDASQPVEKPSQRAAAAPVTSTPATIDADPESQFYYRTLPSNPDKKVRCRRPSLSASQRLQKQELPQVQALKDASRIATQELSDSVRYQLWRAAWIKSDRNAKKHGSGRDQKGRLKVPRFLSYFVRKSLLAGKPLSFYYPALLNDSPDSVLASL